MLLPRTWPSTVLLQGGRSFRSRRLAGSARRALPRAGPAGRAADHRGACLCRGPAPVALGCPRRCDSSPSSPCCASRPGTALVILLRGRMEPGLVLGTSLAWRPASVVAQSMVWMGAWWPKTYRLPPRRGLPLPCWTAHRGACSGVTAVSAGRPRGFRPCPALAVTGGPARPGSSSIAGADLERIAGIGLLDAMPPTYFLAFALLLVGFAVAVSARLSNPSCSGSTSSRSSSCSTRPRPCSTTSRGTRGPTSTSASSTLHRTRPGPSTAPSTSTTTGRASSPLVAWLSSADRRCRLCLRGMGAGLLQPRQRRRACASRCAA